VPSLNCEEKAGLRPISKKKFFHSTKYLSCESVIVLEKRRAGSKLEGTYRETGNILKHEWKEYIWESLCAVAVLVKLQFQSNPHSWK